MVQQSAKRSEPPAPNAAASFRKGELVEALDTKTGNWVPNYVVGGGSRPSTFSLAVPDVGVVPDVAAVALRRATRMRSGDLVEVHDMKTNEWYPGTVLGDGGKEKTYDVDVPISGKLADVPAVAVRRAARLTKGERVEVMDPKTGLWAPGVIESDGTKPGTYTIDGHDAGMLKDVLPVIVRRAEPPNAGDLVQVLSNDTHQWTAATVVSNGTKVDTFLLVIQDLGYVYDVPAVAIRKAVQKSETAIGKDLHKNDLMMYMDQVTGTWVPVVVEENGTKKDTYVIEAPLLGKMFDVSIASLRSKQPMLEGDNSEVLDMKTGVWIESTVVGDGREPYTIDITIPEVGFFPDVPHYRLRHAVYPQPGEVLEVIDSRNQQWIACRVLGPGTKKDTYNLSIPKVGRMSNVNIKALRRVIRPSI